MAVPVDTDVRSMLEGYGIDTTILTKAWIDNRITKTVVPYVERYTRMKFSGIQTVTEYYSGNGKNVMMLNRRPIVEVLEIKYVIGGYPMPILNLAMTEVVLAEGIIKSKANFDEAYFLPMFAKGDKNIKVTYTYGYADYPADVFEAVTMLASSLSLGFIGARTGGGSIGVQGYSRNYGPRGMYNDIRNDLDKQAHGILNNYKNYIVGS